MHRRQFISLVGGATVWPLAARAQPERMRRIGVLMPADENDPEQKRRLSAFLQRLRELGWIEGRNVAIEYRWAEGRNEPLPEIARDLVRLNVDVIVTSGNEAVRASKQATLVIPIVFTVAGDPLGTGLIASLARPGGNVTGLSLQQTDLAGKRVDLLRRLLPDMRRLAVMANVANPGAAPEMDELEAACRGLGLDLARFEIRRAGDIAPAFESLKGKAEALYVVGDSLMLTNRVRISILAVAARLPTIYNNAALVESGGLLSYGPNISDMYRRTAELVDKIRRGTRPAEIPVEQPTNFDFVINLTTAQVLGLTIPPTIRALTTVLIE